MPERMRKGYRHAFTLTELMTVVTILSTTLALLLPTIVRIVQWNRNQTDAALVTQHLDRLRERIERDIERAERVDEEPDGNIVLRGTGFEVFYRPWNHGIAREEIQPPEATRRQEFYRLPSGMRLRWNPSLGAWLNDRAGPMAIGRLERIHMERGSAEAAALQSGVQWLQWRAIGGQKSIALWQETAPLHSQEGLTP